MHNPSSFSERSWNDYHAKARGWGPFIPKLRLVRVALFLFLTFRLQAQLCEVVLRFAGAHHGRDPAAPLLFASDGNLYGTTSFGGEGDFGTIFRLSTNGVYTYLSGVRDAGGRYPLAGLAEGPDGNFYGTTSSSTGQVYGTVFRMTPAGAITTLALFRGTNGAYPEAELLLGGDGAFYGTTRAGGTNDANPDYGGGTVFRVTTNGLLKSIATLDGLSGVRVVSPLAWGPDGMLYGTAVDGGVFNAGTVFRVGTNGGLTRVASFDGTNGSHPRAGLLLGRDGAFYGTTETGGISPVSGPGYGTVFRVMTNGVIATLGWFGFTNGSGPQSGLVEGKDGAFYGVTPSGGVQPPFNGTIFRVTTNGSFSVVMAFDAFQPNLAVAEMILAPDGSLYGTSLRHGGIVEGTIFRLSTLSLALSRFGSASVLSWRTNAFGFGAQYTTNPGSSTNWQTVTGSVYEVNGRMVVTNTSSEAMQLYRLIKP